MNFPYHMLNSVRSLLRVALLAALLSVLPTAVLGQNVVLPHILSTNSQGSLETMLIKGYLGQPILAKGDLIDANAAVTTGYIRVITQALYSPPSGSEQPVTVVYEFHVGQNYPNPFNPTTVIPFTLDKLASGKIQVFNLLGQVVSSFDISNYPAGQYQLNWDAKSQAGMALPSGDYFLRLQHDARVQVRKLTLIK